MRPRRLEGGAEVYFPQAAQVDDDGNEGPISLKLRYYFLMATIIPSEVSKNKLVNLLLSKIL